MKNTMENCEKEKKKTKRRLLVSASASVVVLLLLVIGLSRAWFVSQANIETLLTVAPPSPISIRGPHAEELTALNLSYTDKDVTKHEDGTTTVDIKRVISVCSDNDKHKLEIVHTTNLKGLQFHLYEATEVPSGGNISDSEYQYQYNTEQKLSGRYINGDGSNGTGYGAANNTQHSGNFGSYEKVQKHAEPIYWEVDGTFIGKRKQNSESVERTYVNYYVIEISWTETDKESDIFYVLAKDA